MSEILTSGEFAKRSRLSAKALRLYHTRGLLVPASVNPNTGFRYYEVAQLERARMIILLRGLGMPLAEIASVLDASGPEASQAVLAYWDRMEHEHAARRGLMAYVRHLLAEGFTMAEVEYLQRDVPAQRVITLRRRVRLDDLQQFWGQAHRLLIAHLASHQACLSGPIFGLFHGHVSNEADGPVELCVPTDSPIEPAGDIGLRVTRAHREVYVEVTKAQTSTPTMVMIHDAMQVWLTSQGLTHCGPTREVYYPNFTPDAADDEHILDVALPFR